jgi:hypothetical protein
MAESRFSSGAQAMAEAKAAAARNQGGFSKAGWFSVEQGSPKVVRFLHGIDKMYIYNHSCGLANWEIGAETRTDLMSTGQFVCPACKQPFLDSDFVGERPGVLKAPVHNNVITPDGKKSVYVCLAGSGFPCPLCAMLKPDGKPLYPLREKVYGSAVIRKPNYEDVLVNNVPSRRLVSIEDSMVEVEDREGQKSIIPEVVVVNQAYSNFWQALDSVHAQLQQSGGGGISWFDFMVTRIGDGLDTKYSFDKLSQDPMPIPFSQYAAYIPDVERTASYFGSAEYYHSKGVMVQGYVPPAPQAAEGQAPAQQYQAPVQQQFLQQPQGVVPVQAPAPVPAPIPTEAPLQQPVQQPVQQPMPVQQPLLSPANPQTEFEGMQNALAEFS